MIPKYSCLRCETNKKHHVTSIHFYLILCVCLTTDAIARDLHQDQFETLFSKIEDVQSSVLLMKANEKVWQETIESDWESRGEWTSCVMHHIGQNNQRTLILQQENNRIKEQLKQYHTDNQ